MKIKLLVITIFFMTMLVSGCGKSTEPITKSVEQTTPVEKTVSLNEYYSKLTFDLITESLASQGVRPDKYENIISTELFSRLNFAALNYYKAPGPYDEIKSFTYPTATVESDKIICKYTYTYERYEKGTKNLWGGSWDAQITVTYELKNGEWYLSKVNERP